MFCRLSYTLIIASVSGLLWACNPLAAPQKPIKIGVQGPLTGQYAAEGQGFLRAVELLADQINAEGGLLDGRPVEIVTGDDRADRDEAERVARRLVEAGVVAVVGSYTSDATETSSRVYDEANVLQITPSSTATRLSEPGYDHFFRTCIMDDRQGEFAANLMVNALDKKRIVLVHDNTTYALGLAEWTRRYLEELDAQVVLFTAIRPGQRDFSELLQDMWAARADAVYFTAYYPEAGLLVKQMKEADMTGIQFIGGDAVNTLEFVSAAGGQAATGAMITTMPLPIDLSYPATKQFLSDYLASYSEEPVSIYTLTAADAFKLIVLAIRETGSDDPTLLAKYLRDLRNFSGVSGPVVGYNEKGERQGSIHVAYRVSAEGQFVIFTP
jgi:branched-chain amino acid transport system substrate-binding protein